MASVPQVQPPPIPPWFVPRPRLFSLLQGVLDHRLSLVVAGPGFGKSTILSAWGLTSGCAWYTAQPGDTIDSFARGLVQAFKRRLPALDPGLEAAVLAGARDDRARAELLAGLISEALEPILPPALPLIVDAAEHLGTDGGSVWLLESLARQAPAGLRLVYSSRVVPVATLGRESSETLAIGPSDLAFTQEETAALFLSNVRSIEPKALQALHVRTGGWPAAVRLVVERMQAAPEAVHEPGFDLEEPFSSLADEVLLREPAEVLELLSRMSELERFTPELCEALGLSAARPLLDSLARRGLFVQYQGGSDVWLTVHLLLREYAQERWPLEEGERQRILLRASEWLAERGFVDDALSAVVGAGDRSALGAFLRDFGQGLISGGSGARLLEAGELVPPELRDRDIEAVLGWASRLRGAWTKAFEHYRVAAAGHDRLPARLAWRIVEAHYLRGDLTEAVQAAARADRENAPDYDRAMLLSWEASAYRRRGDRERARPLARAAREIAERTKDPELIATTYTTESGVMELPGDDPVAEALDRAAWEAAERSGNLWIQVRFLTNRAEGLGFRGRFREADELTGAALRLAESSGDPFNVARVLEIRALAALGEGRLAEAVDDASAARGQYERAGSHFVSEASLLLGHAHRTAGELAAARVAYEQALVVGEAKRNPEIIQPALAGLVRILALEDPAEARRLADRGLSIQGGPVELRAQMLLATGWAALAGGDRAQARSLAEDVSALAAVHRFRAHLAEATELCAMSEPRPDPALLERALELWREVGNALGMARIEYALATLGAGGDGPTLAAATRRLQALGVRPSAAAGAAGLLGALPRPEAPAVEIRTLGGFAVLRLGTPVRFSEWKSKKARDLLKILVARRGLPTHREFLMEALWPEESPERLSNRLSVALAILRSVLDPARAFDHQHFVTGEEDSVRLNTGRLAVDVEEFLSAGREALSGLPRTKELVEVEAAEALYAGDFLEEDPYEDWATHLREQAKSLYVEVCRTLAAGTLRSGRHESTVGYGLKILTRDPFDEVAHLLIVRALAASGRHGEARRRYRVYVSALDEIGVSPSPYPGST